MLGRRADEGDAVVRARPGELGVLGKEAVPGVDRVDAVLLGDGDDGGDVQIPLDRHPALGRADQVRFIGLEAVQREAVFVGVDGDGLAAPVRWRLGRRGWRFHFGWRRAAFSWASSRHCRPGHRF